MKLLVAAALAAAAAAQPQHNARTRDWKVLGRADKTARKTFSVAMPMRDYPGLERTLLEISDPYNPRYGQWLTWEQANVFAATPKEIKEEVVAWATSTGAVCKELPESLKCEGSVASIEQLLDTELSVFGHTTKGTQIIRVSAPATVPSRLTGKVVMVTGLTQFPVPRLGNHRPVEVITALGDNDYSIVPETLATLYNISFDGSSGTTQAPIEFQGYPAYVASDLATFAKNVGIPAYTIPTSQIIGPFSPSPGGLESTLDEQYIGAIGQKNNNWYWTEGDWLYEFGQDLQTQNPVPSVLSMSYAWYELDQCDISPNVAPCQGQPVPAGSVIFVNAVNQLFAKATATGVTLLAASGDSGAHGRTDPSCSDPHTRAAFPSSSPWVTSVGATELENGQTGSVPNAPICSSQLQCATGGYEIVASNKVLAFFSSGGGFSTIAARPSWQDAAVSAYLKNSSAIPPAGDFNSSGRGAPDVAALGHNYYIEDGGSVSSVDGTSCATPVVAGLIANLNSYRASKGKPVVGFVNPLLYAAWAKDKTTFNDVVQGDNTCTEDACPCPVNTGYYAAPGWDATTGLGTPNYLRLRATIDSMGI